MAFAGGQRLTAALLNGTFTPTVDDVQDTQGTTTSTSFTPTLTGGTACGVSFVAPLSGTVLIHNSAFMLNSSTPRSYCTVRVGTGGTIGGGTPVVTALDANSIASTTTADGTRSKTIKISGLTPGATYNVQQQFKVSSASTGTFSWKKLVVEPVV